MDKIIYIDHLYWFYFVILYIIYLFIYFNYETYTILIIYPCKV